MGHVQEMRPSFGARGGGRRSVGRRLENSMDLKGRLSTSKGRIALYAALGVAVLAGKFGYDEYLIQRRIALMPEPVQTKVRYKDDVYPILVDRCYKCHGGRKENGDFSLASRERVLAGGEKGKDVRVGNSRRSRMIQLLVGGPNDYVMPAESPRLMASEVAILMAWVDQGLVWEEVSPGRK